jgi:hypothetical protein
VHVRSPVPPLGAKDAVLLQPEQQCVASTATAADATAAPVNNAGVQHHNAIGRVLLGV